MIMLLLFVSVSVSPLRWIHNQFNPNSPMKSTDCADGIIRWVNDNDTHKPQLVVLGLGLESWPEGQKGACVSFKEIYPSAWIIIISDDGRSPPVAVAVAVFRRRTGSIRHESWRFSFLHSFSSQSWHWLMMRQHTQTLVGDDDDKRNRRTEWDTHTLVVGGHAMDVVTVSMWSLCVWECVLYVSFMSCCWCCVSSLSFTNVFQFRLQIYS